MTAPPTSIKVGDADPWIGRLRRDGYCIVRGALPADALATLDADLAPAFAATPFGAGNFYGGRTKRFGRLLTRSPHAAILVQHALIEGIVAEILLPHCDVIQLNVAQAIAVHPGSLQQMPHRDEDMWRAPKGTVDYLVNVIWPFTRFTADNGATLVWPGSHRADAVGGAQATPVAAAMMPGDALVFLGSTLHGAGANHSDDTRRACVIGYSLGWLKSYENQFLAYPPEIARTFPAELAALIGYRQHRPNLGNHEGDCPSRLLRDGAEGPRGAIDALLPEQVAMVNAFADSQAGAP